MAKIVRVSGNKKRKNAGTAAQTKKLVLLLAAAVLLLTAIILIAGRIGKAKTPEAGSDAAGVIITEISAGGQSSLYDEDGDYPDFIELYNTTGAVIDLSGWHLTDNEKDLDKYEFTDVSIAPGEYLIIFASGKDRASSYVHTNFKLSAGETVYLSTPSGYRADCIELPDMADGVSYGRDAAASGKWVFYSVPTPGQANSGRSFDSSDDAACLKGGPLFISEVSAAAADAYYDGEDWIEIYNMSAETVELSGWGLSDSAASPQKWLFPEGTVIGPGEYMTVAADGNAQSGALVAGFKLRRYSDGVYLSYNGVVYDALEWGVGRSGVSVGINSADDTLRRYYTSVTPGSANDAASALTGVAPQVCFSAASGCYDEAFTVSLYTREPGAEIRYTADGSMPDENSALYTDPLTVSENSCIRARSYMNGRLESELAAADYVIGAAAADIPTVFITLDEDDFDRIYTDSTDQSRPRVEANITLVEADGTVGFSEEALIAKHGNMSALEPQKSLAVYFRESAGKSELDYKLFPDDSTRVTSFRSFILRSGGNDWDDIKIKDGMLQTLGATEMDLDYQGFRSCVVYINGEYWGLYNIREKENEDYLASYYGIDADNVDIISFAYGVHDGSYGEYNKLLYFIENNDLDDPANWQTLESMMDVNNMIDTYLMHIYYGNFDTVNIKWWRERTEGAKWRWFVYDLDYALYYPNQNNLALVTDPEGHGVGKYFSSALIYNLMQSENFRNRFLERTESYWQTIFAPDTVITHWYALYDLIAPEMTRNLARWDIPEAEFEDEMEEAYDYIVDRPAAFRRMLQNYFSLSDEETERRFPLTGVSVPRRVELP